MTYALAILVDGTIEDLADAKYETIRTAIGGGYIQAVGLPSGDYLYCDEEGKMKGMPENFTATALTSGVLFQGDFIAGPAVICGNITPMGNHEALRPEIVEAIRHGAQLVSDMKTQN